MAELFVCLFICLLVLIPIIIIIMYSTPTEVQMLSDINQTKKKTNNKEEDIAINISMRTSFIGGECVQVPAVHVPADSQRNGVPCYAEVCAQRSGGKELHVREPAI